MATKKTEKNEPKSKVVFLKKIVAKNLVQGKIKDIVLKKDGEGKDAKFILGDGEIMPLYKVVGQATGYKTGETQYGEWIGFQGNFEAYDSDGVIYKSSVAFVQEPLQTMIRNALDGDESKDIEGADNVEFGLEVSVKRRDDLECNYEYMISPLLEVQQSDSLSHLRQLALPES